MNIIQIPLDAWPGHDPVFKYDERTLPISYIVMHSTVGTDSRKWLSLWNKAAEASEQNNVSIHYLVQRDGLIYQIIQNEKRAWHAGKGKMPRGETDCNSCAIGIEMEHLNEPDYSELQLDSTALLVDTLMKQYKIDGKSVVSHASIALPAGRKIDPVHFDWADFWDRVAKLNAEPPTSPPITPTDAAPVTYTKNSPTLSVPAIDADALITYVATKKLKFGEYTQDDIRLICSYYKKYGEETGIDWLFALCQCIHETGWWSSWWSQRPRRNPAGIGVTGQLTSVRPADTSKWAFDGKKWHHGYSYDTWDLSVQSHISRLLLYALPDDQMTAHQLAFSTISGADLGKLRGCAPTIAGFNGTWAVPGKTYAQTIADIINSFLNASQTHKK